MVEPEDSADGPRPRPRPTGAPAHRASAHRAPAPERRARNRAALLAAVVIAVAVAVAATVIVMRGRSGGSDAASASADQQSTAAITDSAAADAFTAGATSDVVAVTTYDYRNLDVALSNGEQVTTGAYRTSFRTALTGSVATAARSSHRVQTFRVLAAGIGALAKDGSSATVLTFGVQSVTDDTTGATPRQDLVTLTATVERQGNRYLVAGLSAGRNAGLPAGTAGLRAAAEAGRAEVVAVLTLRHDHFDADYASALNGAVDPLRSTLSSQSAATRQRITKGGYDLAGTVTAVGVQQASGDTLILLVAATGTRTSGGRTTVVADGRYRVTVVRSGERWVTSSIDPVTAG